MPSATSAVIAAYAFAMPFDNIAIIPGLGTVTWYLALAVAVAIGAEYVHSSRRCLMKPSPSLSLVLLLLLWALASTLWSLVPSQTLKASMSLAQLGALYVLVSLRPWDERSIAGAVSSAAFGGLVAAAVALVFFRIGYTYQGTVRVSLMTSSGHAADPNHFGASLILPLMVYAQQTILGPKRVIMGACSILVGLAMALTGSRGAVAGAVLGLMMLFAIERIRPWSIIWPVLAMAVITGIAYRALPTELISRFSVAGAVMTQGSGRLPIWRVCIESFLKRPITGWGYNTVSALTTGATSEVSPGWAKAGHQAHNIYLQMASELGFVGLGLVVGFGVMNIARAQRNGRQVPVFGAIAASLFGLHVTGATLGILDYKYFWLVQMLASVKVVGCCPPGRERADD